MYLKYKKQIQEISNIIKDGNFVLVSEKSSDKNLTLNLGKDKFDNHLTTYTPKIYKRKLNKQVINKTKKIL